MSSRVVKAENAFLKIGGRTIVCTMGIDADFTYLNVGKSVIYDGRHKAKVVAILTPDVVEIRFDDPKLIPPTMEVHNDTLRGLDYTGVGCPKCVVPWKETPGFRFNFFDCPQCGIRKEDCVDV